MCQTNHITLRGMIPKSLPQMIVIDKGILARLHKNLARMVASDRELKCLLAGDKRRE